MSCCCTGFRCSSTAVTTRPASRCSSTARSTRSGRSGTSPSSRRRWPRRSNGGGPPEFESTTGIAHTRWATHGGVTEDNAHPHFDTKDRVHIVLNGIVENHTQLRKQLLDAGAEFTSETDAEVVAHLIAHHYEGDLVEAVRAAYNDLRGHYAFVAMTADEPGRARRRAQGVPADRRRRRRRAVPRVRDPRVPARDAQGEARERRRDRRDPARGRRVPRRRRERRSSARRSRWTGTPTPPRRAATTPSC